MSSVVLTSQTGLSVSVYQSLRPIPGDRKAHGDFRKLQCGGILSLHYFDLLKLKGLSVRAHKPLWSRCGLFSEFTGRLGPFSESSQAVVESLRPIQRVHKPEGPFSESSQAVVESLRPIQRVHKPERPFSESSQAVVESLRPIQRVHKPEGPFSESSQAVVESLRPIQRVHKPEGPFSESSQAVVESLRPIQ
ncbi:zinc finger protein 40 [Culex quinquefasciatus]|uniref:Zinc finger protein 40 n=1 Tax=Culex quinquefasciatus TaxID=7176 RepID=B0XHC3_CULQU|nr:zinc finger protein 40 [Culex quinquefasciatus]|eukprot:XP_001869045.1 zinc finger protein 40 [Culex quinquefasciatus]